MSAVAGQPDHFVNWLKQKLPDAGAEIFAPRMIYGDYIEELLRSAIASSQLKITQIEDRAVAADTADASAPIVVLASGKRLTTKTIVLAPGNFPPEKSWLAASLIAPSPRFHDNPWSADMYDEIGPDEDVLLIGTGLTMIDVVLQLKMSGHRGRCNAFSRHGYLPQPHFSYERLAREQTTSYLSIPAKAKLSDAFKAVRKAARVAEREELGNWRCVMAELRERTASIWAELDVADRRRFLHHVRQLWEVHRHRMAPEIAAFVDQLRLSGELNVFAARFESMIPKDDVLRVSFTPKGGASSTLTVGHVINCTGPETDFRKVAHPLISSLRSSGTLVADDLGLGAVVTAQGAVVDAKGVPSKRIFAIGSLRKGSLWESTAVPEIRDQARDLANLILEQLSQGKHSPRLSTAQILI
jgi:uncharacterized NAD(P)/FAD-binding protein YdhS